MITLTDIKLRPYQKQFIDDVRNEFRNNHKRVVGKTIMTGWMIKEAANRGKRSIFFVHRHELIEQTAKTFTNLDIPFGVIEAGCKMQLDLPVQIASIQTLAKRIDNIPAPDFLICDECHHILANTYKKVLKTFPDAFLLGVTATPQRMGGITLCDVFTSMVKSLSVDELISLGNLTPFHYFAPDSPSLDLSNVRTKFGEFVEEDLEIAMSSKIIIGNIVDTYKKLAEGKSAICYCVNVNHSKSVAQAFNDTGISAAHVDGETPKADRAYLVDQFRRGDIQVLCNAELFGEGFDVPHCQAVILARPTQSLTLYIQQALRPLRPDPNDPNKVAVIIDHVQNYLRHGLPNYIHDWSLEPNLFDEQKKKKKPRKCPDCQSIISYKVKTCPFCGYVFPDSSVHITEVDANLSLINTNTSEPKKIVSQERIKHAFTKPEEFMSIAIERGYKIGWVAFQSLKHASSYEDCLHIADICKYNKGWAYHKWQEISPTILQNARLLC